jgi:hypothetical protein
MLNSASIPAAPASPQSKPPDGAWTSTTAAVARISLLTRSTMPCTSGDSTSLRSASVKGPGPECGASERSVYSSTSLRSASVKGSAAAAGASAQHSAQRRARR